MMEGGVKLHLKEWLVAQIHSGQFDGLCWEDQTRTMFRIPWKHAAKKDYNQMEDAALFKAWAVYKGKYREGRDKADPTMWKTRLRCALNKSSDFQEVPERNQLDISEPYKVYRVVPDPGSFRSSESERMIIHVKASPYGRVSLDRGLCSSHFNNKSFQGNMEEKSVSEGDQLRERGSSGDQLREHGPVGDQLREHGSSGDQLREHGPVGDQLREHGPVGDQLREHGSVGDQLREHGSSGDQLREHGPVGDQLREHGPVGDQLREHTYCEMIQKTPQSKTPAPVTSLNPGLNPADVRMQVTLFYQGRAVMDVTTTSPDGCFILQGAAPLGSERIYGPCAVEQLSFPSPNSVPLLSRMAEAMNRLLVHLERGVLLWVAPDGVFIKRFCQGRVFWSGPAARHHDRPNKLERDKTFRLLDIPRFIRELQSCLQGKGPRPSYQIELCFGEEFPDPNVPKDRKLILAQVVPMFAVDLLRRFHLELEGEGTRPPLEGEEQ